MIAAVLQHIRPGPFVVRVHPLTKIFGSLTGAPWAFCSTMAETDAAPWASCSTLVEADAETDAAHGASCSTSDAAKFS